MKFHGFGNDYIVIERDNIPETTDLSDLAKSMCNRHTGVGGDGIAVLNFPTAGGGVAAASADGVVGGDPALEHSEADYFCEIVNPDGSIAGFSGNGTRCAVAYLHYKNIWTVRKLRLETRSGIKTYELIDRIGDGEFWFEAEIGKPIFQSRAVPVITSEPQHAVINEPIIVGGQPHTFAAVNVGNPVACIFVQTFDFDWRRVGRLMEVHEVFPHKANIVFVRIIDRENIEIRIWERATGETSSSGTCSSGAAVLTAFTLKTGRSVNVHAEGGTTKVLWRDDDEIVINGRADLAFSGEWPY